MDHIHPDRSHNMVLIAALATLAALTSCGLFGPTRTKVESIQLASQLNANQNTATAIDIVFIYDSGVLPVLPKTGPAWFAGKSDLLKGLASNIEVVSLQIPPAMLVNVDLPERHGKAIAVYCFANYLDPAGQSFGNITPYETVQITLTPSTVLYQGSQR